MKIYTKKGDKGTTFLFGGGPYPKDAERIAAYGEVDELNSVIGCALSELTDEVLIPSLRELQEQLFVLGAELATVNPTEKMKAGFVQTLHINELEELIDLLEAKLSPQDESRQAETTDGGPKQGCVLGCRAEYPLAIRTQQFELGDMAPECAGAMVILAMYVVGYRAAHRNPSGARHHG